MSPLKLTTTIFATNDTSHRPMYLETAGGGGKDISGWRCFVADLELKECLWDRHAHMCPPHCLERQGWEIYAEWRKSSPLFGKGYGCVEEHEGLYWLSNSFWRQYAAPSRAHTLVATKVVTVATYDGAILRETPQQTTTSFWKKPCEVIDEIPLDHLKMGHRPHMSWTIIDLTETSKIHTRREAQGVCSADISEPWSETIHGHVYMLVVLHRATKMRNVRGLPDAKSSTVVNAVTEMKVFTQ